MTTKEKGHHFIEVTPISQLTHRVTRTLVTPLAGKTIRFMASDVRNVMHFTEE